MSAHTPGPWIIDTDGFYPVVRANFRADHHMTICGPVHGYMYAEDEKANQAANAHLIAAAPELLAALQALVNAADNLDPQSGVPIGYQQLLDAAIAADAAIAKATGAAP